VFTIKAPSGRLDDHDVAGTVAPADLLVSNGFSAGSSRPPAPDPFDVDRIRLMLINDLLDADIAIDQGRQEDAHRVLIHAQDLVFELHLNIESGARNRRCRRSNDIHLRLANRLIDANRSKDQTILAECRALVDLLAGADTAS
jgi:hypothetical protein